MKGGLNIKKHFGDAALAIFVAPPSMEVLAERLRKRNTDNLEALKKRLDKAAYELSFSNLFDMILVNDKLEETLIEAERKVKDFLHSSKPASR